MWLSEKGNLRVDVVGKNRFRFSRWNSQEDDWQAMGESNSMAKTTAYIRAMKMTEYPDVPDFAPTE